MLSVIICSINPGLLKQVSENIAETVGVQHEIIAFDNREKSWGICKVYNYCAEKAKYDHLCFLHEDVKFHTDNWGQKLLIELQKKDIGLIGIAGAVYKAKSPSTWSMIPVKYYRTNNIQRQKNGQVTESIHKVNCFDDSSRVAVVDGVFLAMRKIIFSQFKFDEQRFKNFHFYDMDISLRIAKKYTVSVTYKILVEHFSEGNLNKTWVDEAISFYKQYKNDLPSYVINITKKEQKKIEHYALISFLFMCIKINYSFLTLLKWYIKCLTLAPLKDSNLKIIKYFILEKLRSAKTKSL